MQNLFVKYLSKIKPEDSYPDEETGNFRFKKNRYPCILSEMVHGRDKKR